MSADPDAPEWASYAGAWHDAQMHTTPAVRDEVWSGQGWSEKPDRREVEER